FSLLVHSLRFTLFPYTSLFRSACFRFDHSSGRVISTHSRRSSQKRTWRRTRQGTTEDLPLPKVLSIRAALLPIELLLVLLDLLLGLLPAPLGLALLLGLVVLLRHAHSYG